MKNIKVTLTVCLLIFVSALVINKPSSADSPQSQLETSQAAKTACADGGEGDACTYTDSNGQNVNGTCRQLGSSLTCVKT